MGWSTHSKKEKHCSSCLCVYLRILFSSQQGPSETTDFTLLRHRVWFSCPLAAVWSFQDWVTAPTWLTTWQLLRKSRVPLLFVLSPVKLSSLSRKKGTSEHDDLLATIPIAFKSECNFSDIRHWTSLADWTCAPSCIYLHGNSMQHIKSSILCVYFKRQPRKIFPQSPLITCAKKSILCGGASLVQEVFLGFLFSNMLSH